jgi:hypothetical protein
MFAYLFSPDLVTAGGTLLGAAVLFAAYHLTGHLRRRPGPLVTVPGPRVGSNRPLTPGMLVEVTAGEFRGLAGWVREICLLHVSDDGICRVKLQLNDGRFLWCERDDVAPLI